MRAVARSVCVCVLGSEDRFSLWGVTLHPEPVFFFFFSKGFCSETVKLAEYFLQDLFLVKPCCLVQLAPLILERGSLRCVPVGFWGTC